ncbi:MAG: hypothetical protein L0Z48_06040 [candidate division Zixibacteria bacterium]|nr:hypothetical protein [candidate division Zixibacteria bacterium]
MNSTIRPLVILSEAKNLKGTKWQAFLLLTAFCYCVLFSVSYSYAQAGLAPVEVKASLSKDKITVGDVTAYTVEVFSYPEVKLDSIPFGSNLASFEIKKDTILPAIRLKGREVRRAVFDITAFTIDTLTIPPLQVTYRNQKGDSGGMVFSPALKLVVVSLLEPDSAKHRLKAEKPPFEVGINWRPWIGLTLWALAALAFVLWVLKHKAVEIIEQEKPDLRPPWEIARAELEELLLSTLLTERNLKHFHIRLSEIFRWYAHRMYKIPAEDLTTEEQLAHLRKFLSEDCWAESKRFLVFCDLVKFARWEPGEKPMSENIERLKKLIEVTRPKPKLEAVAEVEEVTA